MLRLNKKPFIFGLGAIFCLSLLFISSTPAQALSTKIRQVRTKESATVYYLYHAGHRKKAYLNAETYLDYGNKWSDVKIVGISELSSWPNAKLLKLADSSGIYYINGNKKVLIANMTDLQNFSLSHEPIITVSQTDLNQYQDSNYVEIGLKKAGTSQVAKGNSSGSTSGSNSGNLSGNIVSPQGTIKITEDLVTGTNNNTLLTSTNSNLMGIFHFAPSAVATITAVTFDFGGLSSGTLLGPVSIFDENDVKYNASASVSQDNQQVIVTFRTPLIINPSEEKTMKVVLDLDDCPACNNQTLRVELRQAASIQSSLTPQANFPLRGTEFKIVDGSVILGQVKSQEESIASDSQNITGATLIGKFTLTENTGHEDVVVSRIIFRNSGSAGKNDWDNFNLYSNGQIIARSSLVNSDGDIQFDINYLRLHYGVPVVLTVTAGLQSDYSTNATINLGVRSILAVGVTYSSTLAPAISNLDESFTLH